MSYYTEREELVINHLKKVLNKKTNGNLEAIKLIELFKNYKEADYKETQNRYQEFEVALWKQETKSIEEIFEGDRYSFLELLFGEENAKIFKAVWDKATSYSYSVGGYRRSYKTKKASKLYLNKNMTKLREYLYLTTSQFSLDKYFQGERELWV